MNPGEKGRAIIIWIPGANAYQVVEGQIPRNTSEHSVQLSDASRTIKEK